MSDPNFAIPAFPLEIAQRNRDLFAVLDDLIVIHWSVIRTRIRLVRGSHPMAVSRACSSKSRNSSASGFDAVKLRSASLASGWLGNTVMT